MKRTTYRASLTATASGFALICCAPALAQSAASPETPGTLNAAAAAQPSDQNAAPSATSPEIVVTGTRIERAGFSSPTPLTVVGQDALVTRAPSSLIDSLDLLPQFRKSSTPMTGGLGTGNPGGGSFVNARGLGPNRTLVLLDGERVVPTTSVETIDISLLPQTLIKRVDVVTGGASAAYGSDAVAGVVNFILDTGFRGLKGQIEGGVSSHGDGEEFKGSLTWGADIGDRLHVLSSVEYYKRNAVGPTARDWHLNPYGVAQNPNYTPTNGQHALVLVPNYYIPNETFGGLIVGGPLAGTQFLPNGATSQYQACGTQTSSYIACSAPANLPWNDYGDILVSPVQRATGYTRLSYDVGPGAELYIDGLVGTSKTSFNVLPASTQLNGLITIQRDNAYLPDAIRAEMTALGLNSFNLGRFSADFGLSPTDKDASIVRLSTGANVTLGGSWKAKAYATWGVSHYDTSINNTSDKPLLLQSIDAVISPTTGQPVCRSTLTNPANGCVPVDILGNGSPSSAAIGYFNGSEIADVRISQGSAGANVTGDLFSTWAGPVSIAVGGEGRREHVRQVVDNVSLNNGWLYNSPKPLDGLIKVAEAFGEVVVPLAKDAAFAHDLELNAAGRVTHYNTVGTVETWKAGLTYEPVRDIRFRGTLSRDIRAPNAVELFSPTVGNGAGVPVVDPRNNQPVLVRQYTAGNPALKPEIADTFTGGIVIQPRFLPGFSTSIDYYNVRINGAISTLNIQSIVNGCQAGNAQFCSLVVRDSSGALVQVTNASVNVNKITTRGVDIESAYNFGLSAVNLPGTVTLHALANYVPYYVVNSGGVNTNFAGDMLNTGISKWSADFSILYKRGDFTLLGDASYIGSGKYNVLLDLQNNHVSPVWYFNMAVEQGFRLGNANLTAYLNIDNLFDKAPPFGFANGGQGPNYDHMGRYFKVGLRFQM